MERIIAGRFATKDGADGEWRDGDWSDFNPVAAPRLVPLVQPAGIAPH